MTPALLRRIRSEYDEMPGLSVTLQQACRLWQIDEPTCRAALDTLVAEHFLRQRRDGAYTALPRPKPASAKAGHPGSRNPRSRHTA
ncbi:MAG: hypothetical protein FJW23_12265 [Acidimicrobiia bacterium]|nr:hypothetical protein [Acidimicrobiia bacterium]